MHCHNVNVHRSVSMKSVTVDCVIVVGLLSYYYQYKELQFIQVLTASCIDLHIENSKNDKKVILTTITSPKRQCDAE